MDGTLWDAVETYANGYNEYFKANTSNRFFTRDDLARYMGLEQSAYLQATMPEFEAEDRERIYKEVIEFQYQLIAEVGGHLYPGVREGLEALSKHYNLFIVSNCPEFTIMHFMKWAKIEDYITDTMAHGVNFKPKFENIRYLIEKHQLRSPCYVGDTASDALQSSKVPLPFVFVDYGFGTIPHPELSFSSFAQLTEYFTKLKSSRPC